MPFNDEIPRDESSSNGSKSFESHETTTKGSEAGHDVKELKWYDDNNRNDREFKETKMTQREDDGVKCSVKKDFVFEESNDAKNDTINKLESKMRDSHDDVENTSDNNKIDILERESEELDDNKTASASSAYVPRWRNSQTNPQYSSDDDDDDNQNATTGITNNSNVDSINTPVDESDDEDEELSDLPLFASPLSKQLHLTTKKLSRRRATAERRTRDHRERVKVMREHLHNVTQEIDHTNALVDAMKRDVSSEEHLSSLAEREHSRHERVLRDVAKETAELKERFGNLQKEIYAANEAVDTMKSNMNWNQEELEQWAVAAARKEEDNLALQKYTRADEMKIKELCLTIERLTKLSVEKRVALEKEMTETQSCRTELERAAEIFAEVHAERKRSVGQWRDTIGIMRKRDEEIEVLGNKFEEVERRNEELYGQMAERRETLMLLETETDEINQAIEAFERMSQSKREQQLSLQSSHQALKDELEVLKFESVSVASTLLKKKLEFDASKSALSNKKQQLSSFKNNCQKIRERLEQETKATSHKERAAKDVEEELLEHKKRLKQKENEIKTLNDTMFKESQHLADLRRKEADLIMEIKSTQTTSKGISTKLSHLDTEALRQSELIYNADFQIQQMERKIARGMGERSDDEKIALQSRISQLESDLDDTKAKKQYLLTQYRKLTHELRTARRTLQTQQTRHAKANDRVSELQLEITSSENSLRALRSHRDDLVASHDVMRVDVRRSRDNLSDVSDAVRQLENRREQLGLSAAERRREVGVFRDVRVAQFRAVEEERHKCAVMLSRRKVVAETLRSKYESLRMAHSASSSSLESPGEMDGGGGFGAAEGGSQVYYLIRAAQKKDELQREGDELDRQISLKEKEVRAMTKTLAHLRQQNSQLRNSFSKATDESHNSLAEWKDKVDNGRDRLFKTRSELSRLGSDCDEKRTQLHELETLAEDVRRSIVHLRDARDRVLEETSYRDEILRTRVNDVKEMARAYLRTQGCTPQIFKRRQKLFRADALNANATALLRTLAELEDEFPEVKGVVRSDLEREGLLGYTVAGKV